MGDLTRSQREMLEHICGYSEWGGAPFRACAERDYYAPLRRLLRRGLIERRPHPSQKYRSHFVKMMPTAAGRLALQATRPAKENEGHGRDER